MQRATELMLIATGSKLSGAFVCCIQRSEVGLLLELGPRSSSYSSSHLHRCSWVSVLNSGCRRATELVRAETDSESSCAFVRLVQRSQLGLLLELGPRNY
eukprot:5727503-Pyramimonas_sp.AAC.1